MRIAIFLVILSGANALGLAIAYVLHPMPEPMYAMAQWSIAIDGILLIMTAVGMIYRMAIWRMIAAWNIGSGCGYILALVIFGYWPLRPNSWNRGFFEDLVVVATSGYVLWAITNPAVQLYFWRAKGHSAEKQPT